MGDTMEIALTGPSTIRLKGKQATLLINPLPDHKKVATDGTLFFSRMDDAFDTSTLEGNKILIDGAGEYEISGVKIAADTISTQLYFEINLDTLDILVSKASVLAKRKDDSKEYMIAVIQADTLLDQSVIAAMNLNAFVLYGEHASEIITKLGKEDVTPVTKSVITKEKLPTE